MACAKIWKALWRYIRKATYLSLEVHGTTKRRRLVTISTTHLKQIENGTISSRFNTMQYQHSTNNTSQLAIHAVQYKSSDKLLSKQTEILFNFVHSVPDLYPRLSFNRRGEVATAESIRALLRG